MARTRKHYATMFSVALSAVVAAGVAFANPDDAIRIDTGLISGQQLDSGVRAYFGVPYAAPPVRELRWREPHAHSNWKGIYHADRKAPECIQNLRAHDINHYFGEEATGEDCLYLNIWTPPASVQNRSKPAPVLVWIYGGGFTIGSSGMANYDGANIARKGVVFVSLNYRLGVIGFMAHPELTAESSHKASGNYGLLDQVAALQWIHRNIAAFGGDPNAVTIMGQSAGSMSVFDLQASPLTKGLFQRVVGMSGGPGLGADAPSLAQAEQSGRKFMLAIGANSLSELRQLPADRLLAAQNKCLVDGCEEKLSIGPIVDGYFLPRGALEIFAAGRQRDVPALLGFTHDESWNDLATAETQEQFAAIARRIYGHRTDEFLRLYKASADVPVKALAADAVRDGGMATVMRRWATVQRSTGKAPVYMYVYSHVHPYAPGIRFSDHDPDRVGAYHTSDVPYFLETLDSLNLFRETRRWTDFDRRLADEISDSLIAFVRTGDPTTPAIRWPRYDAEDERLVEFSDAIRLIQFDKARMNFMASARTPFVLGAPAQSRRND